MIKDILESLDQSEREALMDAFNQMEPHIVKLDGDKFIAVHLESLDAYIIEEEAGYFKYGSFK